MRVLVFHGYLLRGTGSNVYNAALAQAFVRLGHEVHLLAQDRDPAGLGWVDADGDWDGGALDVRRHRDPVRCTVYRPPLAGVLPVYVADVYEGIQARTFLDLDPDELAAYLDRNVTAVREVAARVQPDVALANHEVMGPAILARALAGTGIPFAVKSHGSALEYTIKADPDRFAPYAVEGMAAARGVLVGSGHTARSLWSALATPEIEEKTRLGPPGVDVGRFLPRERAEAAARLATLRERLAAMPDEGAAGSSFARSPRACADALGEVDVAGERVVLYVGKLIVSKGVDLLLAAWPLVQAAAPDARLLIVGFGGWRAAAEAFVAALQAGDLDAVRDLALEGRGAEGGERAPLPHLLAFLDRLAADPVAHAAYLAAAEGLRVTFAGRLEHAELTDVLPLASAQVVPSTFPESFGMVAAEAAACGVLPVSAAHSGLAEVSETLRGGLEADAPAAAELLSFAVDGDAVDAIADRLSGWLGLDDPVRVAASQALVRTAREHYSWEGVARGVIAAAEGRLDDLTRPSPSSA